MKILGVELRTARLTDEEYVAAIRKMVARSKRQAALHAFFCLFFLGTVFWTVGFMDKVESALAPSSAETGSYMGFLFGVFAGFQFMIAVQSLVWAAQGWLGLRTERMMLRYHDELYPT